MKKYCMVFFTLVLGLTLAGLPSAYAQDEFTLEEIVVTAEKREVNVQDTAMSVTAVTGADIRDKAQNTLEDVLRGIASVEVAYANRGGQINIRGIGSYVDTSLADPAVAVIEDNIYNGNSLATFGNMYDIDRVEVLRGPQGTLYGRNATGGTINVLSRKPIHEFEIMGTLQLGDYNLKHFDGAVNFPLSEQWAARVAVLRETRDGYLSTGDMDANTLGARAKLLWEPNDRFSVLATWEYFWQQDHGSNSVPIGNHQGNLPQLGPPWTGGYTVPDRNGDGLADDFLDANLDQTADLMTLIPPPNPAPPGPPIPPLFIAGPDGLPDGDGIADLLQTGWILPAGASPWTNDEWHPGGSSYITKRAYSLEINYDFGWSSLTAIPSIAESYNHNVDSHLAGISQSTDGTLGEGQKNEREQTAGEIRLTSPAESNWFWIAGYYYMKSDNSRGGFLEQDPTTYKDNRYHTASTKNPITSSAVYGQTTYPLTDRFRVTGGIRLANDAEDRDFRIGLSDPTGTVLYDSGWMHYASDVDSTTYKGGIEFDINEGSMLYAQVATGFKQGGLNNSAPPNPFEGEELTAYEVGIKNRFMENRMQLNLEAFSYTYDQMQAQMPIFLPVGDTGQVDMVMGILNAKEGKLSGIDIEMDYLFYSK
ncbi:TonB-dependent receptor [Deltaproteobacteria bacterium]|nr:TonB-dependent receptor [Deltaproteobacteria bacterium]